MNLIPVAKRMLLAIVITSCIGLVVGLFFVNDKLYYVFGVAFGTAISIFRLYFLNRAISKVVTMDPKQAKLYATGQYYFRFFITFFGMLLGAIVPFLNIYGTIIGVFSFNVAAYAGNFLKRKDKQLVLDES